jgi:type II secretory pathway component PulJ
VSKDKARLRKLDNGYSLVELLVATVLFTIITGTVFSLLMSSQLQYQGESGVSEAFQQANVAIDQIVRDVHSAGFPPRSSFLAKVSNEHPENYALPFAWSPKYPGAPCTVNVDCSIPGDYDLILEADTGNGVQWIRYSLKNQTLRRAITRKAVADPVTSTDGDLLPYLDGVMNGDKSLAIFSYVFDAGAQQWASNIREVNINLLVQSAKPDPVTHVFRTINLNGQAVRFNPNQ